MATSPGYPTFFYKKATIPQMGDAFFSILLYDHETMFFILICFNKEK
jgi:hypothetical protein